MLARQVLEEVADGLDAERARRLGDLLGQRQLAPQPRRVRKPAQGRARQLVERQLLSRCESGGDTRG